MGWVWQEGKNRPGGVVSCAREASKENMVFSEGCTCEGVEEDGGGVLLDEGGCGGVGEDGGLVLEGHLPPPAIGHPQCFQAQIRSILVFIFSLLLLSDLVFIDYM